MAIDIMEWTLEIEYREWVMWGYGPKDGDSPSFIDRAITKFKPDPDTWPDLEFTFPFELPQHDLRYEIKPAQEWSRTTCWGWRFTSILRQSKWKINDRITDAIKEAVAYAQERDKESLAVRSGSIPPYCNGLNNMRITHDVPGMEE